MYIGVLLFLILFSFISTEISHNYHKHDKLYETCENTCLLKLNDLERVGNLNLFFSECSLPGESLEHKIFLNENYFNLKNSWKDALFNEDVIKSSPVGQMIKHLILNRINMCNGACYKSQDLKSVIHAEDFLLTSNDFSEEKSEFIKNLTSNLIEYNTRNYQPFCYLCLDNRDDSFCDVDPVISCTTQLMGQFVSSWGYYNSKDITLSIPYNMNNEFRNFITLENTPKKTVFPPGYIENFFFTVIKNVNSSNRDSLIYSWNLGNRVATSHPIERCESRKDVFSVDKNKNNISDICEIAWYNMVITSSDDKSMKTELVDPSCLLNNSSLLHFLEVMKTHTSETSSTIQSMEIDVGVMNNEELETFFRDCDMNDLSDELEIKFNPDKDKDKDGILDKCLVLGSCIENGNCLDNVFYKDCISSPNRIFNREFTCSQLIKPSTTESEKSSDGFYTFITEGQTDLPESTETTTGPSPRGSCSVPNNKLSCIDSISIEYCLYINGLWSEHDCVDRDDVEDKKSEIDSHKNTDIQNGARVFTRRKVANTSTIVVSAVVAPLALLVIITGIYVVLN